MCWLSSATAAVVGITAGRWLVWSHSRSAAGDLPAERDRDLEPLISFLLGVAERAQCYRPQLVVLTRLGTLWRRIAAVAAPAPSITTTSIAPAPAAASPQAKPLSRTITFAGAALAGGRLADAAAVRAGALGTLAKSTSGPYSQAEQAGPVVIGRAVAAGAAVAQSASAIASIGLK